MGKLQIEKNFTRIQNDILDALCSSTIPGQPMRVLLFIVRKTNGFGKDEDYISYSQISDMTGFSRQRVKECISRLRKMNIIKAEYNGTRTAKYAINTDPETWIMPPKKKTSVPQKGYRKTVTKKEDSTVPILDPPEPKDEDKTVSTLESHKRKNTVTKERKETAPFDPFSEENLIRIAHGVLSNILSEIHKGNYEYVKNKMYISVHQSKMEKNSARTKVLWHHPIPADEKKRKAWEKTFVWAYVEMKKNQKPHKNTHNNQGSQSH